MQFEKYTVVIVTYNRKSLLAECIDQVRKQTVRANNIIVVNNSSTDGTGDYLQKLKADNLQVVHCTENVGGAGGFALGVKESLKDTSDCVLLIDDDAILSLDYMEQLLTAKNQNKKYSAFAGKVLVEGKVDIYHRKKLSKVGMFLKNCEEELYQKKVFECDIASFCGMLVNKEIIKKIGVPQAEYFIWHDDTEYSLRIKKYTKFLVVSDAELNHKTSINKAAYPRRYEWRDYYAIRNRILFVKKHGSKADKIINYMDLFIKVVFRNWLFGLMKVDNYDWNYEKDTVKKAIKDAGSSNLR